jgi:hypothetical protein
MQQIASWRSEQGSRAWLTALISAMDKAAMGRHPAEPCEPALLEQLHCQLSNPVSLAGPASPYSLRN